jgi:hypothetical protein
VAAAVVVKVVLREQAVLVVVPMELLVQLFRPQQLRTLEGAVVVLAILARLSLAALEVPA